MKFVFCTTEPNKVPDTILSRCQRFDFGMIGTPTITSRLQQIAEAEGMRVDEEAVELVARRAGGSMRDAQSLFDQLLAFGSDHIAAEDVHRLLGTAPDERLVELVDACVAADAGRAGSWRALSAGAHFPASATSCSITFAISSSPVSALRGSRCWASPNGCAANCSARPRRGGLRRQPPPCRSSSKPSPACSG